MLITSHGLLLYLVQIVILASGDNVAFVDIDDRHVKKTFLSPEQGNAAESGASSSTCPWIFYLQYQTISERFQPEQPISEGHVTASWVIKDQRLNCLLNGQGSGSMLTTSHGLFLYLAQVYHGTSHCSFRTDYHFLLLLPCPYHTIVCIFIFPECRKALILLFLLYGDVEPNPGRRHRNTFPENFLLVRTRWKMKYQN